MKNSFGKTINISYSSWSTYKSSPYLWFLNYVLRAEPDTKTNEVYGDAGTVVHKAIEEYIEKQQDPEQTFREQWMLNGLFERGGFNGKPLDIDQYLIATQRAKERIDFLKKEGWWIRSEVFFNFKIPELSGFMLKGYVDVEARKGNEIILLDWKTNSSVDNNHINQRKFYSYLYWKKYGKIPAHTIWEYIKIGKSASDTFTEKDMIEVEKEIFSFAQEVEKMGLDETKYPLGDWNSPFNSYKKRCEEQARQRQEALKFGIAIWGDVIKIVGDLDSTLQKGLDKQFRYEKKDAFFIQQNSNWDGVVHLYNTKTNSIGTGYLEDVKKVLYLYGKKLQRPVELELKDMRNEPKNIIKLPNKLFGVELRDYQQEAVHEFLKAKYGIVKLKTGMGKTILSAEIIRRAGVRTLFIIDRVEMVRQTAEVYEKHLGVPIGTIMQGKINLGVNEDAEIVVGTYQTISRLLDVDLFVAWLSEVGLIVFDECHGVSAKSIKSIAHFCENTKYRLGLSATPLLKEDFMEVINTIGPIIYEMSNEDERVGSFLSESDVTFIGLDDQNFALGGEYHDSYRNYIVYNKIRNQAILELVNQHKNKKILIITKLIEHAELLSKILNCPAFIGDTKNRKELMENFRNSQSAVMIGSIQIFSQGIDVPDLDVIIQASAPSGEVKTIQTIGRALRKKEGKEKAYYYDFNDAYNKYLKSASWKRKQTLKKEGHIIKNKTLYITLNTLFDIHYKQLSLSNELFEE